MKKTRKALLAVLACTVALAGAAGLAACGGGKDGDGHTHNYTNWQIDGATTHTGTCDAAGDCDAKTKTENHDTAGTNGACSVCGYKAADSSDDGDDGDEIERTATVSVGVDKIFDSLDETGVTLTLDGAVEGKLYTLSCANDKVVFGAGINQGNPVSFEYHEKSANVTVRSINGTLSNVTVKFEAAAETLFTAIELNEEVLVTGATSVTPKRYEIQLEVGKYQLFVVSGTATEVKALDMTAPFAIGDSYEDGYLVPLETLEGDENTVEVATGKYYVEAYEDVTFKVSEASVHTHVWNWVVTDEPTADETGTATRTCSGAVGTCGWEADDLSVELPVLDDENYTADDDSATCIAPGRQSYSIVKDGKAVNFSVTTPKKAHTEQTIAAKEPTCTETGLTEGKKCSVCLNILEKQEVVAAKGHTLSTTATPKVNETAKTVSQRCTVCSKSVAYAYDNAVLNASGGATSSASALSDGVNYVTQSTANPYLSYTFETEGTYTIYWVSLNNSTFSLQVATFDTASKGPVNSNSLQKQYIPEDFALEGYCKGDLQYYADDVTVTAKAGDYVILTKNNLQPSQNSLNIANLVPVKFTFTVEANKTLKFRNQAPSTGGCFLIGIDKEPTVVGEYCDVAAGKLTVNDSGLEFMTVTEAEAGTYTFKAESGVFELCVKDEAHPDGVKSKFGYIAFCDRYATVDLKVGDEVKVVKVSGRAADNTITIVEGTEEEPAAPQYNTLEVGNNNITLSDTNITTGKYEDGTEKFYAFTTSESGYYNISVGDGVKVSAVIRADRTHYSFVFDVDMKTRSGVFYAEAGQTVVLAFTGNDSTEFAVNIVSCEEPVTYLEVNEKLENVIFSSFESIVKLTVGDSVTEGTYQITFEVSNNFKKGSYIYFLVGEGIEVEDPYDLNGVVAYVNSDIAANADNTVGPGTSNNSDWDEDYTRTVTLKAGDVIYLATTALTSGYVNITLTPVA